MTAAERTQIMAECFITEMVLRQMPADLPHLREMKIQTQKLMRLFEKAVGGPSAKNLLAAGSGKRFLKDMGERDRQIGEQRRKVRQLSDTFFKTAFRRAHPSVTNKEYRDWRRKFDDVITRKAKIVAAKASPLDKLAAWIDSSSS